jgi:hypothetical protein
MNGPKEWQDALLKAKHVYPAFFVKIKMEFKI